VRETRGVIVQFSYGEDSVDPAKSDHVRREAVRDIVASVTGKELR